MPKLTKQITVSDFKNHYWLKSELIGFCKSNGISGAGSKQEIAKRIEIFITSGQKIKPEIIKKTARDSDQQIFMDSLVKCYNNDAITRAFFVSQIGKHFRFNTYLRQFTNAANITPNLTYGDLVAGWLAEESKKKDPQYKTQIDKQFEYNQFIRDFFDNEIGKTQTDAVKAWNKAKTLSGARTYTNYLSTIKREKL